MSIFDMLNECSWCGKPFMNKEWVKAVLRGLDSSVVDIKELEKHAGEVVHFELYKLNRNIASYILPLDSKEKKRGLDIGFLVCNINCVEAINEALDKEKDFFKTKKTNI